MSPDTAGRVAARDAVRPDPASAGSGLGENVPDPGVPQPPPAFTCDRCILIFHTAIGDGIEGCDCRYYGCGCRHKREET